jgi:uncharacterized protein with PIN domain
MEKKCDVCGLDMVLRPAGVSKRTNEPYDAFWSCPNCYKKGTQNKYDQYDTKNETDDKLDRILNGLTIIHSQQEEIMNLLKK